MAGAWPIAGIGKRETETLKRHCGIRVFDTGEQENGYVAKRSENGEFRSGARRMRIGNGERERGPWRSRLYSVRCSVDGIRYTVDGLPLYGIRYAVHGIRYTIHGRWDSRITGERRPKKDNGLTVKRRHAR